MLGSQGDFYTNKTYTKIYEHVYTCLLLRIVYHIYLHSKAECKEKQKGRVLHIMWRHACIWRSHIQDSRFIYYVPDENIFHEREPMGFLKLRTASWSFFFYLGKIYSLRDLAPQTDKLLKRLVSTQPLEGRWQAKESTFFSFKQTEIDCCFLYCME